GIDGVVRVVSVVDAGGLADLESVGSDVGGGVDLVGSLGQIELLEARGDKAKPPGAKLAGALLAIDAHLERARCAARRRRGEEDRIRTTGLLDLVLKIEVLELAGVGEAGLHDEDTRLRFAIDVLAKVGIVRCRGVGDIPLDQTAGAWSAEVVI